MISDRIKIKTDDAKFLTGPCDLCDELNFPQLSWKCTWDDPYVATNICYKCLRRIMIYLKIE